MCQDVLAYLVVASVEGHGGVVEVEHVGLVVVDQLEHAVLELLLILLGGQAGAVAPVPLAVDGAAALPPGAVLVVLGVELLRVESFPPLALAVGLGQVAVVRLRGLQPRPGMRGVYADAEGQSGLLAGVAPAAGQVLLGSDVHRVPLLVGRVPQVEVVVVVAQCHEVACTHALVEADQLLGVPVLGFPVVAEVFQSECGRVAEVVDVPVVLAAALVVHEAGVPVAVLGVALRSPVCPDAELGILEPFRALPGRE